MIVLKIVNRFIDSILFNNEMTPNTFDGKRNFYIINKINENISYQDWTDVL